MPKYAETNTKSNANNEEAYNSPPQDRMFIPHINELTNMKQI